MDSTIKNTTAILLILTAAFVGYYVFIQKDKSVLSSDGSISQELFVDVQKYIERREVLSQITLDTTIFRDERFQSLQSFSDPEQAYPMGRNNPFDLVNNVSQ